MPRTLLLLDFDRTLFDTARFFDDIWGYAAEVYGIDHIREKLRAEQFYDVHGSMYDYRFFDHLRSAVGERFSRSAFEVGAHDVLGDRFLFDDVTDEVLRLTGGIVTFGGKDYQEFKLSFCPRLAGIPRHIILGSKADYIARVFEQPTLLVDDKPLAAEIRPPARFLRIDRSRASSDMNQGIIATLREIEAMSDLG